MSRENQFTPELMRLLKSQGAIVIPYVAGTHGLAGCPDRIVWSVQWRGFMELKTHDRAVTPKQLRVLQELDRRCAWSAVEVREVYLESSETHVDKTVCEVRRHHHSGGVIGEIVKRRELLDYLKGQYERSEQRAADPELDAEQNHERGKDDF